MMENNNFDNKNWVWKTKYIFRYSEAEKKSN